MKPLNATILNSSSSMTTLASAKFLVTYLRQRGHTCLRSDRCFQTAAWLSRTTAR